MADPSMHPYRMIASSTFICVLKRLGFAIWRKCAISFENRRIVLYRKCTFSSRNLQLINFEFHKCGKILLVPVGVKICSLTRKCATPSTGDKRSRRPVAPLSFTHNFCIFFSRILCYRRRGWTVHPSLKILEAFFW